MVSLSPPLDGRAAAAQDRSWTPRVAPALAALLVYAVVLLAPQVLNDGDSYWHVAAGGWMLDHRRILHTDAFSYTFAGRPWHTHEWLAEVLMALAWRVAGWSGVVLLHGAAAGAAMAVVARRLDRVLPPLTLAVVLLLVFGCLAPGLLARPHLLALPLLAAWTAGLLEARDAQRAPPLALAALMIPWANIHGGYFLGLALIAPFALEALLEAQPGQRLGVVRAWGLFGLASLAASLVTPFGVSGLVFPFQLLGMTSLSGVAEWRPMDFSHVSPMEIALLVGLYVLLQRGVRIPPVRLILLLLLLQMTLAHTRHQMLLAVIGAMLLAEPLGRALAPDGPKPSSRRFAGRPWVLGCTAAALVLAAGRLALPIVRSDGLTSPIAALNHVPAALRSQPVLNDYGFGGYLIAQGVRPFIDGRTDMYGDAFTNAYFRAEQPDPAALDALLARWKVSWTILAANDPVVGVMDRKTGWRRLYADRHAVVHVRDGAL